MTQAKANETMLTQQVVSTVHVTLYQSVREGKDTDVY